MTLKEKYLNLPAKVTATEVEGLGTVYVRRMKLAELEAVQALTDDEGRAMAFVRYGMCDEEGKPVWLEGDEQKIKWAFDAPTLTAIVVEIQKANTVGLADVETAKKD
jgi:hypothetical protein